MKTIITNKDVREGIKNGIIKTLEDGNIQIVELEKGHIYQARKLNKAGRYVSFSRFNERSLEEAMEYVKQYKL